jgi:hypothetical protein
LREAILSRTLGEFARSKIELDASKISPAHRELRKTGLLPWISGDPFCKSIYQLSKDYQGLNEQRITAIDLSETMSSNFQKYRNAAKTARRCSKVLTHFDQKYGELVDFKDMQPIYSTIKLVKDLADLFESRGKASVWDIHPAKRKPQHVPFERSPLFVLCDYPLDHLGEKRPDQWFWFHTNVLLQLTMERAQVGQITSLTRFRLIAAISGTAIRVNVTHLAVKEFFLHLSERRRSNLQQSHLQE